MKILFDHQVFTMLDYGGVSRLFFELMSEMDADPDFSYKLGIRYSNNVYLKNSKWSETILPYHKKLKLSKAKDPFHQGLDFAKKVYNKLMISPQIEKQKQMNQAYSLELISRGDYDIFHPTFFDNYFLESLGKKNFVLSIFDMIHEIFTEYNIPPVQMIEWKKKLAMRADKIITISQSAKKDIIRFYGLPEEKIDVVYLGNSLNPDAACPFDKLGIQKPYLLYVGNRAYYKNFLPFLKACLPILQKQRDLQIVCAGGQEFTREENQFIKENNLSNLVFQVSIDDSVLAALYQNALAFVFPSLYEGFGIPILEAFACNCPVIASGTSSLPEVGGEAAEYFDPASIDSMTEVIRKVVDDAERRKEMADKGAQRLKQFSWKKAADETKAVYKSLL